MKAGHIGEPQVLEEIALCIHYGHVRGVRSLQVSRETAGGSKQGMALMVEIETSQGRQPYGRDRAECFCRRTSETEVPSLTRADGFRLSSFSKEWRSLRGVMLINKQLTSEALSIPITEQCEVFGRKPFQLNWD